MTQYSDQNAVPVFDAEDIEKNKVVSALAYFIFFLPLIVCPDSPFGKFHANQGLILLITGVAGHIILGLIPILGWIIGIFFSIAIGVLAIMGLVNTLNGKAKELPVIGKFQILR